MKTPNYNAARPEELVVSSSVENKSLNDSQRATLKYPRRKTRTIVENTFQLESPTESTSQKMRNIPSKNTSIEQKFEIALSQANIRFCKSEQSIEFVEGKPDFLIPRYRIAIFCDGDFWHGHNRDKNKIKNNSEFWSAKIERNMLRDTEVTYGLEKKDWTVFRFWEHEINKNVTECINKIESYIKKHNPKKSKTKNAFTFVDLFSGIGGFRIPLESLGGRCLAFSEIDKAAIETYKTNFWEYNSKDEIELGSITGVGKLPFKEIDLIVGGVPCQSWSVAGKMRGFEDPRGQLWYDTLRVVKLNKPRTFIFENVKGLIDPRNRSSLEFLIEEFSKLGYSVKYQLLNSYDFGLPQNRDRIFLVGIRKDIKCKSEFAFPSPLQKKSFLYDILSQYTSEQKEIKKEIIDSKLLFGDKIPMGRNRFQNVNELNDFFIFCDTRNGHTTIHSWDIIRTSSREKEICMTILKNRRKKIYGKADGNPLSFKNLTGLIPSLKKEELEGLISKKILKYISGEGYAFVNSKNSAGINGIYRIYLPHSNIFSTLTATGTKDVIALKSVSGTTPLEYKENFISQIIKAKQFRSISSKEAGKLQGFPEWFCVHRDDKLAKKQFGNAVSTNVIYNLVKSLLTTEPFNHADKAPIN